MVLIGFRGQNLRTVRNLTVPDCTLTATSECVRSDSTLTAMIGLLAQIQVYHGQAQIFCLWASTEDVRREIPDHSLKVIRVS